MTAFHSRVYGLALRATAPIAGLLPTPPHHPDVDIELFPPEGPALMPLAGTRVLDYADGTHFELSADLHTIRCSWTAESTPEDTATYLLGPVLAYLLRFRGTLSLHASAVVLGEQAIVLAGGPGAGKSSTAAAFARRGATVITDDVAALDGARVEIGYPRLRLWSDVVETMWGSAEALPLLTPTWTKRYVDVIEHFRFASQPYAVAAICVLGDRAPEPSLRRLAGHEAAMALLRNASMTHALDDSMRERELSQVTELAETVPVFAASAPDDVRRIGELCALIERTAT